MEVRLNNDSVERCPVGSLLWSSAFPVSEYALLLSKTLKKDKYSYSSKPVTVGKEGEVRYWEVEVLSGGEVFSIEIEEYDIFF